MAYLELKVPPPAVALACAGGMKLLSWLPGPSMAGLRPGALLLAALGVGIATAGVVSCRRAQTTVNPFRPEEASELVTTGIYGYTRNPMYLGMAVVLLGWATWLASAWALAGIAAFVAYLTRFQIVPEERALERLFGAAFTEYRARVNRWL